MTPDELPADIEGRLLRDIEFSIADCRDGQTKVSRDFLCRTRALLKAYQQQRRALRPFAEVADLYSKTTSDEAFIDQEDGVTLAECRRARAALNQKGDER
jgi:hypothetical protein